MAKSYPPDSEESDKLSSPKSEHKIDHACNNTIIGHHRKSSAGSIVEIDQCECAPSPVEAREFRKKWHLLSNEERQSALNAHFEHFLQTANELIPCSGCRNSTEALLRNIAEGNTISQYIEDSGLVICEDYSISLSNTIAKNPESSLMLFHAQERWGNSTGAKLGRSGKSNVRLRCILHSQSQKTRTTPRPATFETLWNKLTESQQQSLAQIDADKFLTDLESYLRRHRFCCRCKEKVLEVYDLLIGTSCSDEDCEECAGLDCMDRSSCDYGEELHYTSFLYDELSFCRTTGQIIVPAHMDFMSHLMTRADKEMVGEWGDRHARTMAEAQDEVLTCLGMVIWEDMQNIWTQKRSEKRCEELLVYIGITTIKRCFDIVVEALHGEEMMEQLLAEEDDESRRLERKKEKRKEKKKKRKNAFKLRLEQDENNNHRVPSEEDDGNQCECKENRKDTLILSKKKNTTSHFMMNKLHDNDKNNQDDLSNNKLDETMEMQLLSSMGWMGLNDEAPEEDESNDLISPDEIMFWKKNQQKLVDQRMQQRQEVQERFNQFVLRGSK